MGIEQIDGFLELLKRLQRRYYLPDYEEARLRRRWREAQPNLPFREKVVSIFPEPDSVSSLLVFKPDEIGDAVQSLPAVAELRRHFPRTRLFLICRPEASFLFERTGIFDEISAVSVHTRFRRFPVLDLKEALRKFSRNEFDASIFLRTYPAYFPWFKKVPARMQVHPDDPRLPSRSLYRLPVSLWGDKRAHQALQMLELVGPLTGKKYDESSIVYPAFHWKPEDERVLDVVFPGGVPERFYVIHPFARFETRRYPMEYWPKLIDRLREKLGGEWVSVGSKDDGLLDTSALIQAQGKLDIAQTAYLLSRANGFVGISSGPGHLASALGIPTVTLMSGSSLPGEWAPLGQSLILRTEVPCAPCHLRTCAEYDLACLRQMTPERVYDDIARFLAR